MDRASLISSRLPRAPDRRPGGVLIPRERIAARVAELGAQIAERYADDELTILAVLTGAMVFLCDLIRHLPIRVRLETVRACSYPGRSTRSQGVDVRLPEGLDLAGRQVLIVDDILDSGRTLDALRSAPALVRAAGVRICVLLRKRRDDVPERPSADFVGFDVDDHFVVGYGLDYDDLYRNLPDICLLAPAGGRQGE